MATQQQREILQARAAYFDRPGVFPLLLPPEGRDPAPMEALDRLAWPAAFHLERFGLRILVRADDPALLQLARERLSEAPSGAFGGAPDLVYSLEGKPERTGGGFRFHTPAGHIVQRRRRDHLLDCLDCLLRIDVAVQNPLGLVFVHAGVIGWHGRAHLFAGRSRSGKSRLVRALVEAGATYLSDEYAPVDSTGRIYPFARPLSIRQSRGQHRLHVPAASIGDVSREPLPVGSIHFCRYRPGAAWEPHRLTPGDAMFGLLDNTLGARLRPSLTLDVLRSLAEQAPAYRSRRGATEETSRRLLNFLSSLEEAPQHGQAGPGSRAGTEGALRTTRRETIYETPNP